MKLKNKVVVITGASSGIGKELAFQFARKGSKVVLAARNAAALEEIAAQIWKTGQAALAVPTDVTQRFQVDRLMQAASAEFGGVDILISNAGVSHATGTAMETKEVDIRATMEVNYMGGVFGVWAAVPLMEKRGGGQIVFVTSIVGKRGVARNAAYCASKFAAQGFAESLRPELSRKNIRVTTICPPGVDTPFFANNGRADVRKFRLHPVQKIARLIVKACEQEKREALLTMDAKLLHWSNVFFPKIVDWAIAKNKEV